jgi:transcriptional regulator, propionate catabolism operon regulatory protein
MLLETVSRENKNSQVSMALITPYKYMGELFANIAKGYDIKAYVEVASLNEAADIANKLKNQVDVFLSRGGTAEYIKNSVDTPVVSIPVTAFDIMRSVHYAKEITKTS